MSEIPWRCSTCGCENWVDLEHLSAWPIDKIVSVRGFICEKCGMREAISYSSSSLEETLRKLKRYQPGQPKFQYWLTKCVHKAEALRERGETDGSLEHPHLAAAR